MRIRAPLAGAVIALVVAVPAHALPVILIQPDAQIKRSTDASFTGDDVYSTDGTGQTRAWRAKRGQLRTFDLLFQNDGTGSDSFTIQGCGTHKGVAVHYSDASGNVTAAVEAGTYTTDSLAANGAGTSAMQLKMKPTKTAKIGATVTCLVTQTSTTRTDVSDGVAAKLTVRSG